MKLVCEEEKSFDGTDLDPKEQIQVGSVETSVQGVSQTFTMKRSNHDTTDPGSPSHTRGKSKVSGRYGRESPEPNFLANNINKFSPNVVSNKEYEAFNESESHSI